MKKKFLWLLPYFPYPPLSGGNVRVFNLIKYLSRHYDIHLLSYHDYIEDSYVSALEKYCKKVIAVERKLYEGELPLIFQHYYTPEMIKELDSVLKDKFDFIQIDFLTMAYYVKMLKEKTDAPVFFTEHDVSSFDFDKCFHNRHLPDKPRYFEWIRMLKVMDEIYPLFDCILTVSSNDAEILNKRFPGFNIRPAPTGTDCSFYEYRNGGGAVENLVYVGHYIHYPNLDSVKYFLDDIFPLVLKRYPDMRFHVVGSGGEKVKDIAAHNVEVTGTVPDIRKYLYMDGVFVAPIRLGIGIRGKILEAMAGGMPVVSTSLGAAGIGAKDAEHLLVADTPERFAGQIERLAQDKELRNTLTRNARKFVVENYNWTKTADNLIEIYENTFN
jgi:glycosyltransferase involved in cell wall biosynthesis